VPTARRLSQTLGHASSLVMKARRPFIAPIALSCEAQIAAGDSRSARLPKVASQGWRGLSVLRRPAHGRISPNTTEVRSAFKRLSRSIEKQAASRLRCSSNREPRFLSRYPSTGSVPAAVGHLAHPALVCFAMKIQSKVAASRAWPNPSFKRTCLRHAA